MSDEQRALEAKHKKCGYCSGWGVRAVEKTEPGDEEGRLYYTPCPYGDEDE